MSSSVIHERLETFPSYTCKVQAHHCPRARRMSRSASRSFISASHCCCSQRVEGRRRKLQEGWVGEVGAGCSWQEGHLPSHAGHTLI